MLRGNAPATIDGKGRLKVPSAFRKYLKGEYGDEFFITSITTEGRFVRIYPMPEWEEIEEKLRKLSSVNPSKNKFMKVVNYYGQAASMDKQGRILIPQILREKAVMDGEVAVLGNLTCLDVWNEERFLKGLCDDPLTDEDMEALSELGI